jgi:hypothetical protein
LREQTSSTQGKISFLDLILEYLTIPGAMADRKRDLVRTEPSTSSSILPVKKPKISSPTISDYWESLAIDIDPVDLLPTFLDAHSHHSDKVVSNVTVSSKELREAWISQHP